MKKFEELLQAERQILERVGAMSEDEDEEGEEEAEEEGREAAHEERAENNAFLQSTTPIKDQTKNDAVAAQHQQAILSKVQDQVNTQEKEAKHGAVSRLIHAVGKHL